MMGSKKEHMLLNANKSMRLYKTIPGGVVQNDYLFLFQNTDSKEHTYTFEIINNDKIRIVRPKNPIKIGPGYKAKEVVILETSDQLAQSHDKDVSIPLKIKAYAIDEPERIVIERDLIFTYPRLEALKK